MTRIPGSQGNTLPGEYKYESQKPQDPEIYVFDARKIEEILGDVAKKYGNVFNVPEIDAEFLYKRHVADLLFDPKRPINILAQKYKGTTEI